MHVVFNNIPSDSKFTTKYLKQIFLLNNYGRRENGLKTFCMYEIIIVLRSLLGLGGTEYMLDPSSFNP